MKKVFAILAIALFAAPALHAQSDESARFGIKISPSTAWLRPDSRGLKSDGNMFGYTFGLMSEFPIGTTGSYRFATGVFLNNGGGSFTTDYTFVEVPNGPEQTRPLATELRLRYIDIPLTMKMMTNEIGYIRYFAQLGVTAGFNIRANSDFEEPIRDVSNTYTLGFRTIEQENVSNDVNLFRGGLVIGGGIEYNFSGQTAILAGITYNNGFTNILNGNGNSIGGDIEGRRSRLFYDYLELTLGIFF
jgi:hypothetical protein